MIRLTRKLVTLVVVAGFLSACMTTRQAAVPPPPASDISQPPDHSEFPHLKESLGTGEIWHLADLDPSWKPDASTLEGGLWLKVENLENRIKTSGNRITDPALEAYVGNIVCRLAGPFCQDIRLYIVRAPVFNAFMTPNGMMVVYSGLLLRAQNEAQLAMILGHEIAHYLQRHTLKRFERHADALDLAAWARLLIGNLGVLVDLAASGLIAGFSRDQERQADEVGAVLMANQGYDVNEAVTVWARLLEERKAGEDAEWSNPFFATHPGYDERIENFKTFAAALSTVGGADNSFEERFWNVLKDRRFGYLQNEVKRGKPEQSLALLKQLSEGGRRPGVLTFFKGEVHRIRADKEKNDYETARSFYEDAQTQEGAPTELFRSLGLVHQKLSDRTEARHAFETYIVKVPNAPDRDIIELMLNHL